MRTHKIIYILSTLCVIILLFVACNNGTNAPKSLKDTVPSAAFAPEINDTTVEINLAYITNLKFPKYKIIKENPIIPDSISIAYDEESVVGGNYSAILNFDTIPNQQFYAMIEATAMKDACWKINQDNFMFKRKDKNGGLYSVAFTKGSMQILVSHLNSDLVKVK